MRTNLKVHTRRVYHICNYNLWETVDERAVGKLNRVSKLKDKGLEQPRLVWSKIASLHVQPSCRFITLAYLF